MAGRKKIPSKLKVLRGTDQPCRMNPDEPEPDLCIPQPPKLLKGHALEEWNRITIILDRLGLMSEMDTMALAAYCQSYERWMEAEEKFDQDGVTYENVQGNITANPACTISNQALNLMHKFLTEFGMTPSSRTKVSGKKKDDKGNVWSSKKVKRG